MNWRRGLFRLWIGWHSAVCAGMRAAGYDIDPVQYSKDCRKFSNVPVLLGADEMTPTPEGSDWAVLACFQGTVKMRAVVAIAGLVWCSTHVSAQPNKELYELQERCGKRATEVFKREYGTPKYGLCSIMKITTAPA